MEAGLRDHSARMYTGSHGGYRFQLGRIKRTRTWEMSLENTLNPKPLKQELEILQQGFGVASRVQSLMYLFLAPWLRLP